MEMVIAPGGVRRVGRAALHQRVGGTEIRGCVQDAQGTVRYEVLELRNGGALVWSERECPHLPVTASGGFGWVEPFSKARQLLDPERLRRQIEKRLRSQLAAT